MRILLVEDDIDLCKAVKLRLTKEQYQIDICNNGHDATFYALDNIYDVIVLDRMLPGIDGLTLLRMIRQNNIHTPVILATALGEIQDRIHGLDNGADDYITKPYDVSELSARIRALCRRPGKLESSALITFADLTLSIERQELSCASQTLSLSKKETALFSYIMKNPNTTLTRSALLSYAWGADSLVEEGNLDNYIHFIRKRLKTLKSCTAVRTVHKTGYRLEQMEGTP